MNIDDRLRAVLADEAGLRTAPPLDVAGMISGGRRRRRRRTAVGAGACVLAAAVVAGGAYGVTQLVGDGRPSVGHVADVPSASSLPTTFVSTEIDAGTYVVPMGDHVAAPYTMTVPAGWQAQHGDVVGKRSDQQGAVAIDPFVLDRVRLTDDACTGPERLGPRQSTTTGLVDSLRVQGSGPRVSDPVADTVGGIPATRFDLTYPGSRPLADCRLPADNSVVGEGVLQVWSGYLVLHPAETASVYVVDVGGRSQLFVVRIAGDASDADRAEVQSVLDSIRFPAAAER